MLQMLHTKPKVSGLLSPENIWKGFTKHCQTSWPCDQSRLYAFYSAYHMAYIEINFIFGDFIDVYFTYTAIWALLSL